MTSHPEPIRNPALVEALASAGKGQWASLYEVLGRLSGMPGPKPNTGVAEALGAHLASLGRGADRVVAALARPTGGAATSPAATFFPMCAAMAFAYQHLAGREDALPALQDLAEDTRREVRDGVVRALLVIGRGHPTQLIDAVDGWMIVLMPAAVALEAVGDRSVLGSISRPEPIFGRVEQGLDLVVRSSRSDERTQGYRLLMRALAELTSALSARFSERTTQWFNERIADADARLRLCIERLLEQAPRTGASRRGLHALDQRISATARPPRDPRTVVGPTRRRGGR